MAGWTVVPNPDTSAWTPVAAPQPPSLTDNPHGEGTYNMRDSSGKMQPIPYSQVPVAAQQGYQLDSNPISSGLTPKQQFFKDQGADPNAHSSGGTTYIPIGGHPATTAEYGTGLNLAGGALKGLGTMLSPVLDLGNLIAKHIGGNPVDVNAMLAARGVPQTIGKFGTIGAAIVPSAIANPVGTAATLGGGVLGGTAGHVVGQATGMSPEATALLSDAGGIAGGVGGGLAGNLIPSQARAGAMFQSLNSDLANTPVPLKNALQPLQRAVEIGGRGSTLPKSVSDLLARSESPTGTDMSFPEARDYQSSLSDLSSSDKLAMNGRMRGAVAQLNKGLFSDIQDAANTQGRGDDYASAMNEYRRQAQIKQVLGYLGKTAVGAAGAGTLYEVLKAAQK